LEFFLVLYLVQQCFICRPSDSTVSEDAGIEPRTVATLTLAVRRCNLSARSYPRVRHPWFQCELHGSIESLLSSRHFKLNYDVDPDPAIDYDPGSAFRFDAGTASQNEDPHPQH
jgi:hypothetical protein